MNSVNIIGNITRDLEVKDAGQTKMLQFSVAVQRQFKDKTTGKYESDFINCKTFGKTAEIIAQYFSKGSKIGITGEWNTGSYEKDGRKIYTNDCIVRNITFVGGKEQGQQSTQQTQQNTKQQADINPFSNSTGPIDISDDELPF